MDSQLDPAARWELVDEIVDQTVEYETAEASVADELGQLMVSPWTGLPFAIAVLYGMWGFFGAVAGFFTDGYLVPLFDRYWLPWLQETVPLEGTWVYFVLVGDPAATDSFEAFGMLTSGLFVAVGVVVPALFALYLILSVLEDSGYIPRLAVLLDTVFHRIGLHGFAVVPMVLSFGCNVPGVEATRSLEGERQRLVMMTLVSVFVPCGAQLGVMLSLIPRYTGLVLLYLLAGFFVFGAVLDRVVGGSTPEFIVDIPPLRWPRPRPLGQKLAMRTRGFLTTGLPSVLVGVGVMNVLYVTDLMGAVGMAIQPVLTGWFGVPADTVPALVAGFMRKDLAVAQLSTVALTPYETVMSVIMISIYFPCIATFVMLLREGHTSGGPTRVLLGSLATLTAALFVWGGLFHLVGIVMGVA